MNTGKEAAIARLKEPSTWVGLATSILAFFGFDFLSGEQIAVVMPAILGMILSEKK